jgi:ribosomal protein S18 acetylase RimI-like enzyme
MEYTIKSKGKLHPKELNELFATNNWQVEDLQKLRKSIKNAWCYITVRDGNNKLIGYVQVISDGILHAYILRLIVHPESRNNGIGTELMNEVMKIINKENMKPTLVAVPGKEKFYEKFGFKREINGLVAMLQR